MRDRRVRLGFVVLILSFPLLIHALGDRGRPVAAASEPPPQPVARASTGPQLPMAVWAAEAAILAGLATAGILRDRLKGDPEMSR